MRGWPYFMLINLRLHLRNKQALFFSYIFPLFFLFLYGSVIGRGNPKLVAVMLPLLLTLTALTGSLFGLPIGIVVARERGILRRYRLAPASSGLIVTANILTGYLNMLIPAAYQLMLAYWLYNVHWAGNLFYTWIFLTLTFIVFAGLGMIIAAFSDTAQSAPAIAQIIFLPMMMFSGMIFPVEFLPLWAQQLALFLPGGYAVHGIRGALLHGDSPLANWMDTVILLLGGAVSIFIASQLFRWEPGEKVQPAGRRWALASILPYALAGLIVEKDHLASSNTPLQRVLEPLSRSIAFIGGQVIDGTGRAPLQDGTVLVKDGRIDRVGPEGLVGIPSDARRLDIHGSTVLPGLIDGGVRLVAGGVPGSPAGTGSPPGKPADPEQELRADLYCGVTAVRDLGGPLGRSLELQLAEKDDEIPGPHLVVSGPLVTAPGGYPNAAQRLILGLPDAALRTVSDVEAARKTVRELTAGKADLVSIIYMGRSPVPLPGVPSFVPHMGRDVLEALVQEAHARGLRAVVHTGTPAEVREAIEAGADSVQHGALTGPLDEPTIALLVRRRAFYSPTLAPLDALARAGSGLPASDTLLRYCLPPAGLAALRDPQGWAARLPQDTDTVAAARAALSQASDNLHRCFQRGVRLAVSTGAGSPLTFHGPSLQRELELWVAAGVPPMDTLIAATGANAEAIDRSNYIGTFEPGKEADLVVVAGDPTRDISAMRQVQQVLKSGRLLRRDRLFAK
jgi:imidazolonepropionase-like amidohydrolase/ABC-type multidrug transport system permease subunit